MIGENTGHGHVWERPDGVKARCGGPGVCSVCSADQARIDSGVGAVAPTSPEVIASLIARINEREKGTTHWEGCRERHINCAVVPVLEGLAARVQELEKAIRWALGEDPDGTPSFGELYHAELDARDRGELKRGFWWRKTLRELAGALA